MTDKYKDMNGNEIDVDELLAEIKRFHEMKKWLLENHTQVMLQYTYGRVD